MMCLTLRYIIRYTTIKGPLIDINTLNAGPMGPYVKLPTEILPLIPILHIELFKQIALF